MEEKQNPGTSLAPLRPGHAGLRAQQDANPVAEHPVVDTGGSRQCTTTLFISNLHCPSCASSIEEALGALKPKPASFSFSFILHSLEIVHDCAISAQLLATTLEDIGFEIHSVFRDTGSQDVAKEVAIGKQPKCREWEHSLDEAVQKWRNLWKHSKEPNLEQGQREKHVQQCTDCQSTNLTTMRSDDAIPLNSVRRRAGEDDDSKSQYTIEINEDSRSHLGEPDNFEKSGMASRVDDKDNAFVVIDSLDPEEVYEAQISITGMTCASCVAAITEALKEHAWIRSSSVALLTNSATVVFEGKHHASEIVATIESAGFDANLESLEILKPAAQNQKAKRSSVLVDVDIWKCQYAIGGMTCAACVGAVSDSVRELPFVTSVDVNLLTNSGTIVFKGRTNLEAIGQAIEDAGFDATLDSVVSAATVEVESIERSVSIRIDGIFCEQCPIRILDALEREFDSTIEIEKECTARDPILTIRYTPRAPEFTIRDIFHVISDLNPEFRPSVYHPPTIEDRAREIQARERRHILIRLLLSLSIAVPAFIIGIVCMEFLSKHHAIRQFMMQPMWAGSVGRSQWALFILATPVYFLCADLFHRKAFKEIKALWKPSSRVPLLKRFYKFGSMNMLLSMGTTIAYFSSVAELAIAATIKPHHMTMMSMDSTYFDSVIFLTMFLLAGRYLEAYSKARTGDAVLELGKLRPTEAILVEPGEGTDRRVPIDLLEIGDIVKVPHGASPPFDGILLDNAAAFDESSLTGESRLVNKEVGQTVYSGTVNKQGPVSIRISTISGSSMLDQIIKVVREGQTKRAPVERVADLITGHFVPFVVLVGILTWVIWLALGVTGSLPKGYLDSKLGGWPLWALRFAIAVFVIACPCGIGLAAPTALFVGGGIAAQQGILVKGGGEAFQEASTLDCVVFDKTGTLTEGGNPSVTDYMRVSDADESNMLAMVCAIEENSSHPIAKSIVNFCETRMAAKPQSIEVHELPGKGLRGQFKITTKNEKLVDEELTVDMIVGNETLMSEYDVVIDPENIAVVDSWKQQGKSVALVASRSTNPLAKKEVNFWSISALFSISDALRPESVSTVRALQQRGIAVWMLSGDNPTTAKAVGAMVGIPAENIIAGVLPEQKAEKIQYLQKTLPKTRGKTHATVAMVGDGINDSPALTMADVGIAIGSGSDVAISSASFILVSSNLTSLLTLIDLSRKVFRRIWFNFGWAMVYNIIAMPVAAGVLYPVVSKGEHVRLDPVWAALAMALSSVSVVTSSLLLRSRIPGIGFRIKKMN